MKARERRTEITQDKVLAELASIALRTVTDHGSAITQDVTQNVMRNILGTANSLNNKQTP